MNWIKVDTMSWIIGFAIVAIAGGVLLRGQSGQISPEAAQCVSQERSTGDRCAHSRGIQRGPSAKCDEHSASAD